MNVAPAIQIVQIHMSPANNLIQTSEHFNADGNTLGALQTDRKPVTHSYTTSDAEAATVINQLTAVMSTCTPAF